MYFKPEFKQKILDGSMCAFISKSTIVETDEIFDFCEDENNEIGINRIMLPSFAKAECLGVIKFNKMKYDVFTMNIDVFKDIEISIPHDELGFEDTYLADVFYEKENCMTDSYLHIFKLIDNKGE